MTPPKTAELDQAPTPPGEVRTDRRSEASAEPVSQAAHDPGSEKAPEPETELDSRLPSGRRLTVKLEGQDEALEIRSPAGALELRLRLTPEGPVLTLSGARLELSATELALNADRIQLRSKAELDIESGAEMRIQSRQDMRLNGEMIYIN